MTKIIAFSGKKGSGKSSCADVLIKHFGAKKISFADPLKRFCIDTLGLWHEQCYGTEFEKNGLTSYRWENLPDYQTHIVDPILDFDLVPKGLMSGRQIMQQWADILKRQDPNIFLNAFITEVQATSVPLIVTDDVRFIPEIERGIFNLNPENIVLRCMRNMNSVDTHISETALDEYHHDRYIIFWNQNMTLAQQEEALLYNLKRLGYREIVQS